MREVGRRVRETRGVISRGGGEEGGEGSEGENGVRWKGRIDGVLDEGIEKGGSKEGGRVRGGVRRSELGKG